MILNASARRFGFSQPIQVLYLTEQVSEVDFIAFDQVNPLEVSPKGQYR